MIKKISLLLFFSLVLLLTPLFCYAENCIAKKDLLNKAVLIQKQGHGKGSGILYSPSIVLTNKHVINDIDKVWVYIPHLQKSISATVLYSSVPPDIAVLKLSDPVFKVKTLDIEEHLNKGQKITFVGMPFGKPHLLNAISGIYNYPVKLKNAPAGKAENMNINLDDWAYSGDSGGGYFTCDGKLAGIHFGNQAHKNKPSNAFAVNGLGIVNALKSSKIIK